MLSQIVWISYSYDVIYNNYLELDDLLAKTIERRGNYDVDLLSLIESSRQNFCVLVNRKNGLKTVLVSDSIITRELVMTFCRCKVEQSILIPRFKWISAHLTGSSYGDKVCSLGLLNFSWSHNNDTWNLALEILDSLYVDTKFDRFLHEKSKETYQLDKLDIFPPNLSGSVGHFCC